MNPSPVPPGTLSTTSVVATLLAAMIGAFEGHPWALVVALAICAMVAISRGWTEAWKARGVVAILVLALAMPVRADGTMQPSLVLPVRAVVPDVPAAAVTVPPLCVPTVKPAPAWASYLGWGLAAATEALTLGLSLYQRAP